MWLVRSFQDFPGLFSEGGEVLGRFFGDGEQEAYFRLVTPKRRREWLLGRATAKDLVRRFLLRETGRGVEDSAISICNAASGAPLVRLRSQEGAVVEPDWLLSIAHRGDLAFCAIESAHSGHGLGVDVELVEERGPAFVETFFTAREAEAVSRLSGGEAARAITAFWAIKEALLKALGVGLRADTRSVEVLGAPGVGPDASGLWCCWPVRVVWPGVTSASAWCRDMAGHVLALGRLSRDDGPALPMEGPAA